jgi:hypothetical protein
MATATVSSLLHRQPDTPALAVQNLASGISDFGRYENLFPNYQKCMSERWEYDGQKFNFAKRPFRDALSLPLADGAMIAVDKGEFGGELIWRPAAGDETVLVADNTSELFQVGDAIIAVHGLSHMSHSYGYATQLTRNENGGWRVEEIARFTAAADSVARLADDHFAVNADGRVLVFSSAGVLAEARCDFSAERE